MRILVIESSPHKNGSSNLLADHFIRGAREVGHYSFNGGLSAKGL